MKNIYINLSRLLLVVGLMAFSSATYAQGINLSGTITDENAQGAPGVSVLEKGTTNGTTTDAQGKFALKVADANSILVVSFIGYKTQEIAVGNRSSVDVALVPDVTALEEVVVTGYQVQRKADISGAVSVVNVDDLQNVVASSFAQKLAGRVPGVTISTSGRPGDVTNVRVRGISSFGNNDPLYVIDGVPIEDKGNLNLNPNDIETMQVLKDPSTASIYGSRASNGVVVITTKKGKSGKTKLTYNGSISRATSVKGWDDILITDSDDYLDMTNQYFTNGGQALPNYAASGTLPTYIYVNPDFADGTNSIANSVDESTYNRYTNPIMRTSSGTNWWKEITRPGKVQDHNLTLSGGNDNATFAIAAGALIQEGVLKFNEFSRYNVRANSNFKVGNKVRIGETMNFATRSIVNNVAQSEQGALSQVYKTAPIIPVYDIGTSVDEDGYRNSFGGSKTQNTGNSNNAYAVLYRGRKNSTRTNSFMGNIYGEGDLLPGLVFRTDFKYDLASNNGRIFNFRSPENQENLGADTFQENWGNNYSWTWTNTLSYTKTFGEKHKIYVLAGYEAIKSQFRTIQGNLNNYFSTASDIWYLNTAFGAADTRQITSNGGANSLLSTFGKFDYSYADKYYVSGIIRRDGSSRFSKANQFAVFPAFSVAWRVSGESFMADNGIVSDLKLRASWGKTGNQNIVNYNSVDRWGGTVGSAFYDINGANTSSTTGYHLTNVGTETLGQATKWEEGVTTNVGFDASLLNDKLTVVLDVYKRKTNDLLYNAALQGTFGYLAPNAPFRNIASMENKGFDLGLGYRGDITSDLKFSVDANISHYKNKIIKTDGVSDFFYPNPTQGRIDNRLPTQININKVGHSISSFNGYRTDGIIDTQEELDGINQPGAQVGGLKFKDINGDGTINDSDIVIIGSPIPDFTYGLNIGLTFKNIDFTMFFVGSKGNEIFNYTRLFTHFRQFNSNVSKEYYLNNGKGNEPRLNAADGSSRQSSDYYVEDASYFRLGQLQIGYTVPLPVKMKNIVSRLKIYVQGQNLFTITKYSGLDPALSNANIGDFNANVNGNFVNDLWTGFDIGQYPSNKMLTLGVSADF